MKIIGFRSGCPSGMIGLTLTLCLVAGLTAVLSSGCSLTKSSTNSTDSGSSATVPDAPTGLVVTPTTASVITLSWNYNSDAIGFHVERRVPPSTNYVLVKTLQPNITSCPDTGLITNTIFYYRVKAFNYIGDSAPSNEAGTTTSWGPMLTDSTTPLSRTDHTAVWTTGAGIGMIVWGGWDGQNALNTGAIYSPTANANLGNLGSWTPITTTNAPSPRRGHTAVWAKDINRMIVWGGYSSFDDSLVLDTCDTTTWTADVHVSTTVTASINTTDQKEGVGCAEIDIQTAYTDTPYLAYDTFPSINISSKNSVSFWIRASQHVEPGIFNFVFYASDSNNNQKLKSLLGIPISNALNPGEWTLINLPLTNQSSLMDVVAVGLEASKDPGNLQLLIDNIIVSGAGNTFYNSGAIYDPISDTWTTIDIINVPEARAGHSAVWTGSTMIVWGGGSGTQEYNNGGVYDPGTNEWVVGSNLANLLNGTNAPLARSKHMALWTQSGTEPWRNKMIVWGGDVNDSTGGIYDIGLDIWTPLSTTNAPSHRYGFSTVWTESGAQPYRNKLIIWGGYNGTAPLNDGAIYDPSLDLWTTLPADNAPSARMFHTAIWTGTKMIIWGGDSALTIGGIYNPALNTWGYTSAISAPSARISQTAVWTDLPSPEMIIWGGGNGINVFNTGGRYRAD